MNRFEKATIVLSIYAALASTSAIYFQFLYQHSEIIVSSVETSIRPDSSYIQSVVVYTNDGNRYSTIVRNSLVAYQDYEDGGEIDSVTGIIKPIRRQIFLTKWRKPVETIILSPGQQLAIKLHNNLDTDLIRSIKDEFGIQKKINIGINIDYLNSYGQPVNQVVELGWMLLGEAAAEYQWHFKYPRVVLDDTKEDQSEYYSQSPNTPIQFESNEDH